MTDIVERLRYDTAHAGVPGVSNSKLLDEAADEIERLQVEIKRLQAVLRNIAAAYQQAIAD